MRQFFKFTFASCLGVFLAGGVLFFIGSAMLGSLMQSVESKPTAQANSILEISFNQPIPEKTNNVEMDRFNLETDNILGVHDMVRAIQHAKNDDKIQGIFIDLSQLGLGQANAALMRQTIEDFKENGKFVLAYSQYYSSGTYYIASAADEIHINPFSIMQFDGFAAMIPFFKGMLDNLGIKMQVKYAGQFKSATEPFRRYEMSPQNRLQIREYLEGMYEVFLDDIAQSRNMTTAQLRAVADESIIINSKEALASGLVDAVSYRDEVLEELKTRLGLSENKKIKTISLTNYTESVSAMQDYSSSNKVAIVYAEGSIVDGEGTLGNVGGDKYARIIRKLRKDDNIKAIVLRVNSGGGSGMASENIWREVELAKAAGKPVITSMGDVAASGGYYIACNSDMILAQPNTITGSIGVFTMIPSFQKGMEEKLGIQFDTVKTTRFSTNLTPFLDMSEEEGKQIQKFTDDFYDHFLVRVAEGRSKDKGAVHEIAQGRVWTGKAALANGLVDKLGTLDDAIALAVEQAGIEDYRLKEYPQVKEPLQQFIDDLTGNGSKKEPLARTLESELGEMYPYIKALREMMATKGPQTRMPYFIDFK